MRDNRLSACEPPALALFLVLVTVADAQGLSYYSEASLARLIHVTPDQVTFIEKERFSTKTKSCW